jgi:copper oxidase (laccase) domain-containing protein
MPGSPLLSAIPGLRHGFFTREGGVSDGIYQSLNGGIGSQDDASHVAENRRRMAAQLGVMPTHLLTAFQIHSPDVAVATEPWEHAARPRADAIVTRTEGRAIGVTAADCGPILFVDPRARVIGAAHAGWKGALTGVLESTGAEFVERFTLADADNAQFFIASSRENHAMFDLAGFIRMRLENAGVLMIDDIGIDTYSDERFYSYRRSVHRGEPDYGRHVHAIVLEGE